MSRILLSAPRDRAVGGALVLTSSCLWATEVPLRQLMPAGPSAAGILLAEHIAMSLLVIAFIRRQSLFAALRAAALVGPRTLLPGALASTLGTLFLTAALRDTTPAPALFVAIVLGAQPALTMSLSILVLKERPSRLSVALALAVLASAATFEVAGAETGPPALRATHARPMLFLLLAMTSWSFGTIATRWNALRLDTPSLTVLRTLGGLLVAAMIFIFPPAGPGRLLSRLPAISLPFVLLVALAGILPAAIYSAVFACGGPPFGGGPAPTTRTGPAITCYCSLAVFSSLWPFSSSSNSRIPLMTPSLREDALAVVRRLFDDFGQRKSMTARPASAREAIYFLVRPFIGDLDVAILLNSLRCRYQCRFCNLPSKSSRVLVSANDLVAQWLSVMRELRHCLSTLDRITISNEGSVLDETTFPVEALDAIASSVGVLRNVRRLVLETRLEFVRAARIRELRAFADPAAITILTGFETLDEGIRDRVLGKREPLDDFLAGLNEVASGGAALNAYVLFKPSWLMTDDDAVSEARASIEFLMKECKERAIPLAVRLNPMYVASGTAWQVQADRAGGFVPPRLTDVLAVAMEFRQRGLPVYLGLTSEGLASASGTYAARDDFSREVLRRAKAFNRRRATLEA